MSRVKSFMGLDLSMSSTGLCILNGDQCQLETIKTKLDENVSDLERCWKITERILMAARELENPGICIEDYFMPTSSKYMNAAMKLCQLGTMVRWELYRRGFSFLIVAPKSVKKFACGNGNGQKSLILKSVYKNWGVEPDDDNQADAYVLARIAKFVSDAKNEVGLERLCQYQADIVKRLLADGHFYSGVLLNIGV